MAIKKPAADHAAEFEKPMRELRCPKCRAKLADEYVHRGRLAIKCWRCRELCRFIFRDYRDDKIKVVPQAP